MLRNIADRFLKSNTIFTMTGNLIIHIAVAVCLIKSVISTEDFANIDNMNFAIKWSGPLESDAEAQEERSMVIKSAENEVYHCVLPREDHMSQDEEIITYEGHNEYQLLKPLFDQTTCSYRIESYWTYELCHGKHVRQYHEEKELSQSQQKTHEYTLGTFNRENGDKHYLPKKKKSDPDYIPEEHEEMEETHETSSQQAKAEEEDAEEEAKEDAELPIATPKRAPVVNVDGLDFPYFQLNFTDGGTPCDLTATHRKSMLKYVCHKEGRGEIYEIKETSTCEYQLIVLTYLLCTHPAYKQKTKAINEIHCHSMGDAPSLPRSLQAIENEKLSSQYSKKKEKADPVAGTIDVTNYHPGDMARGDKQPIKAVPGTDGSKMTRTTTIINKNTDTALIKEFLSGEYCLTGGTGWWRYEFCFGRKAIQFHEDRQTKTKDIVTLGTWDHTAHMDWLGKNPAKKPRPKGDWKRKSLSNMYVNGDICDITGKPRFVEVKLKCKENPGSPHSVSIYLVEPKTCEYVLVVESPLLCSVVEHADENGLVDVQAYIDTIDKPIEKP